MRPCEMPSRSPASAHLQPRRQVLPEGPAWWQPSLRPLPRVLAFPFDFMEWIYLPRGTRPLKPGLGCACACFQLFILYIYTFKYTNETLLLCQHFFLQRLCVRRLGRQEPCAAGGDRSVLG